jgi:hypothetical protein
MFFMFSSCTINSQSVSCQCFCTSSWPGQGLLTRRRTCSEKSLWHRGCKHSALPRRIIYIGRLDLFLLGRVWFLLCVRQGSAVALLVDTYLSLDLFLVGVLDAVGSRVDHLGILLIRLDIGFCGSSRCGLGFFDNLPVVPDTVNNLSAKRFNRHTLAALSVPLRSGHLPGACQTCGYCDTSAHC